MIMATNNNGNSLDDSGNVQVDFVWGNMPLQPNDHRTTQLDYTLDGHIIADANYSGYPDFSRGTKDSNGFYQGDRGSDTSLLVDYITVPNVLGMTTAVAIDTLKDAGFTTTAGVSTITTATAVTNTATQPTRINVTSTTAATVTVTGGTGTWPINSKVTIASGLGIPAPVVGTWTVTGGSGTTLTISGSGWTVADSGAITPGTKLTGASGTIKAQSIAAGASATVPGSAITITPWA
jgi:hypothetical protein